MMNLLLTLGGLSNLTINIYQLGLVLLAAGGS
jgi:hypothetical protein